MTLYELKSREGKVLTIQREWTRFGRADDNDLIVKDPSVSRYHLNFYIKNGSLILEDAGSQNGFLVNGKTMSTAVQLKPGDRISVGATEYTVQVPGLAHEPTPPTGPSVFEASAQPVGDDSSQKRIRIYALAAVALFLFFIATKEPERKPASTVEDSSSELSDRPTPPTKKPFRQKSPSEIRSESLFRGAMRDYENGNYSRALIGFQDARSLNPENEEALAYIEFAETRLNNQLEELLKDANRSMKYLQYRRGKSQAFQILTLLSEQIPGYLRKITQESATGPDQRHPAGQEETLLSIPCEKTRQEDLCKKSLDIIEEARRLLGEENTWK